VSEVIQAAATKPFAFMAHQPSPGVGGDCIPVVPFFLESAAREVGLDLQLVQAAARIDQAMPRFTVDKLQAALAARGGSLEGAHVLAIGVTYKPDIADVRESAAMRVMEEALARGARVAYHDPLMPTLTLAGATVDSTPLGARALAGVDAVLLLTPHTSIDYGLVLRSAPLVIDTHSGLNPRQAPNVLNVWVPGQIVLTGSAPPEPNGLTRVPSATR
jgi:UDP-N-acetyl-D-glucosamine dehydrogenase